MARKKMVDIAPGVKVETLKGTLFVSGPKGDLSYKIPSNIEIKVDGKVTVEQRGLSKKAKAAARTFISIIENATVGVTEGWKKTLELVGAGYKAEIQGTDLVLTVGYSHPVKIQAPKGVTFQVEKGIIYISGIDKQLVGEVAAKTRAVRPPEPYKGKGIKLQGEYIRRKPGKAAKGIGGAKGTLAPAAK